MKLETQASHSDWAEFVEHQRFTRAGVVFTTIHLVGSLNGLVPFDTRTPADDAEVDRRIEASLAWIRESFEQARGMNAPAVVVAFHGDPWAIPPAYEGRTGYEEVLALLGAEITSFAKPVLLIHGDTHIVRADHPTWSEEAGVLPNLTRLESFGDPQIGWIEVSVDAGADTVFSFDMHEIGGESP